MVTTGTNGADAIVQSATNKDETITSSSFTVTLGGFSSINNATFGAMATIGDDDLTAGSGFSFLGLIEGVSNINTATEFRDTNDTSVDITSSVATHWGGIGIEIAAAAGGGSTFPGYYGKGGWF